jgi:L-xylulokinase
VAAVKPDESDVVFLPFLFGSNADPEAKACLVGLSGWHTPGHVLRAVYEGVVFGHKAHVDRLMRFREPPEAVRLTGGAARSEVWAQMFADVLATPVEVPAGTELGAKGAAMCAGVAAGCFTSYAEAVQAMVHVDRVYRPDTDAEEVYAAKYRRYRSVVEGLGPLWEKIAVPAD